jgi:hypothetical protein
MSENGVSNQSTSTPTPSRDALKARLRSRLYHTQESRKCSFSHESDLRKKKVPEEMIQPLLNCLRYTNNVLPYPVEFLKKCKDLSKEDIDQKVKELVDFVNQKKGC